MLQHRQGELGSSRDTSGTASAALLSVSWTKKRIEPRVAEDMVYGLERRYQTGVAHRVAPWLTATLQHEVPAPSATQAIVAASNGGASALPGHDGPKLA